MKFLNSVKICLLVIGDLVVFYLSLFLSIFIRYQFQFDFVTFQTASFYFLPVFCFWLLIFFIGRLYELSQTRNSREFYERVVRLFIANLIVAFLYFYLVTPTLYRPKLVLVMTVLFSFLLFLFWRAVANEIIKLKTIKVYFDSSHPLVFEVKELINSAPQLGYQVSEVKTEANFLIVERLTEGAEIKKQILLRDFYEKLTGRVSLELLSPEWFENLLHLKNWESYEERKRILDFLGGIFLFFISLPLWPLIALFIKIDSPGPVIYRSVRIGKNHQPFLIYKFRTMVKDAAQLGPNWTLKNDPRITRIGKLLRLSHLDELPQVLNIIKGDVSFVGPRPEEQKLSNLFEKEIAFYHYRFLMKPGVIGWAQINYPHGSSLDDARKKLEYDFYYFKNRSLIFDFIIALKAWRIPFEIPTH
ncbi:MAG: Bac transf protein [Patescibacteria group bacterium]|nr:Bac transf protein [Patescibacteria group bacterium]